MSKANGADPQRTTRLALGGGIPAHVVAWMERRTAAFQRATTSGPGKQQLYGKGEKPVEAPKPKKRGKR